MSKMRWYKLRNVVLHEFLNAVRHLREPLVAPVIIPLNEEGPLMKRDRSNTYEEGQVKYSKGDAF
jgi:hypothetical protein